MPSCEKCWADAQGPYKDVVKEYSRLVKERDCTPEEQAGPDATDCPKCGRRAAHQLCHVCMACGYDPKGVRA